MDFFNEENYLINEDKNALAMIEKRRLERLEKIREEVIIYRDTLKDYNLFLDMVSSLLKSLDLDSSLEYSIALSYLIHNGYLSYNGEVDTKKTTYSNELVSNFGVNIVSGEGCCRNYAQIHKDIMDRLSIPSKKFYCVQSSIRMKKRAFLAPANHVANMINYDKRLYVFDTFNDARLYKLVSSYEAFVISHTGYKYLTYKPYYELIFGENDLEGIKRSYEVYRKDSKNRHLSAYEWFDGLRGDTLMYLESQKKLFSEFSSDTTELKTNINNSLKMKLK